MNILGIETSCDETAAAIVQNGRKVLSNTVVSSLKEHSKFGGIIPEIASRRQLECIQAIVDQSLKEAGMTLKQVDAIAVTKEPGLIGSLLVGLSFARALSFATNKPLLETNHLHAHLYANYLYLKTDKAPKPPKLPAIGMVVSGGHTQLYLIKDWNQLQLLGQTRDDAVGEAFDKVARILNLGYPGGPIIDKLAKESGPTKLKFKAAQMKETSDFSFSGTKTAVLYHTQKQEKLTLTNKRNIAKAFQDSVVEILCKKAIEACLQYKTKTLMMGGGVSANSALRNQLELIAERNKINVYKPNLMFCLDNAAMIAGLAYHNQKVS